MNLRPPSVTASTQTSAFTAIVFQSPVKPNARMSLRTQSVHSFSYPPRPLRTAPSRFPNMIRFGNCPPLIRRSVLAHKSILVRNVVSMLSHQVISRARLYEVIRWSGLLRCAPMMQRMALNKADAGRDCRTRLARPKYFQARMGAGNNNNRMFPCSACDHVHGGSGNLITRVIHIVVMCSAIYICVMAIILSVRILHYYYYYYYYYYCLYGLLIFNL